MDAKTSKKLNGNGFWESSRMMLPEHKVAINAQNRELKKRTRPNVDFDAAEEIAAAIGDSYSLKEPITIEVFNEYAERFETGIVENVDQQRRRIYLAGEWIKFDDIIGVK